MSKTFTHPQAVLDALLNSQVPPEGIGSHEFERARAFVHSLATVSPADVEQLPETLALAILEAALRSRDSRLAEALTDSHQRGLAKAAKKVLYQLRSLGISVAEKKPEPAPAPSQSSP